MPVRKRKSLDDALAKEFVYGQNGSSDQSNGKPIEPELIAQQPKPVKAQNVEPVKEEKKPKKPKSKSSIQDKLQPIEKEATTRFTVDLANSMHRKLSILAAKTGRTKADIVRMLLEDALNEAGE